MRLQLAVVALVAILPARSLLTPPASIPTAEGCAARKLWGARLLRRRPQASPTMRCKGEPRRARGTADRGSWGVGVDLSSWVARATSFSRSSLYASAPAGIGAWWDGGMSFGGKGNNGGGGNNGTDGGVPAGGAMGEEGDGGEAAYVCSSSSSSSSDGSSSAAELRSLAAKKSPPFAPWVWLSAVWGLYAVLLRQSPLVTKALTSGVLALGGDMAAQFFEFRQQAAGGRKGPFLKDTRRLLAVAIDSILITGPALHTLYGVLERLIPTAAGGFVPAASHLLIDTLVFDPVFVASFFCATGMLENRSLKQDVLPALRREFWPAVHGSWVVSFCFCPLQFITFRYLPLEFRVLSVNVCDIAWTSVLSYFSHKAAPETAIRTEGGAGRHALRGAEKKKTKRAKSGGVLNRGKPAGGVAKRGGSGSKPLVGATAVA